MYNFKELLKGNKAKKEKQLKNMKELHAFKEKQLADEIKKLPTDLSQR